MDTASLLSGYDLKNLTVGVLGGHSALDVCAGAKKHGLATVAVTKKGREATFSKYYRTRKSPSFAKVSEGGQVSSNKGQVGCVDEVISLTEFKDVLDAKVQEKLRKSNTIFVHNRYFWVYFDDFAKVEKEFNVPIFGSRTLLKLEERNQPYNQYDLLKDAGIRTPKIFKKAADIDRPVLVKASEAKRGYERGFFVATSPNEYEEQGVILQEGGKIAANWREATIEEFVVGAPVNFNFFYSPLTGELELLGTDTRRQTNLDGFLRMPAWQQMEIQEYVDLKMIETGHIAVTVKESILEKAFDLGEKFVKATQKLDPKRDPTGKGIIGPFALQGAVVAEEGKEDIVIFDVSLRIPGSPGIAATPYSQYLYGHPVSTGERCAMEIIAARDAGAMEKIVT